MEHQNEWHCPSAFALGTVTCGNYNRNPLLEGHYVWFESYLEERRLSRANVRQQLRGVISVALVSNLSSPKHSSHTTKLLVFV